MNYEDMIEYSWWNKRKVHKCITSKIMYDKVYNISCSTCPIKYYRGGVGCYDSIKSKVLSVENKFIIWEYVRKAWKNKERLEYTDI